MKIYICPTFLHFCDRNYARRDASRCVRTFLKAKACICDSELHKKPAPGNAITCQKKFIEIKYIYNIIYISYHRNKLRPSWSSTSVPTCYVMNFAVLIFMQLEYYVCNIQRTLFSRARRSQPYCSFCQQRSPAANYL